MSKHLLKFDTETAYKTAKRNHLLVPNVSLVSNPYNVHVNSAIVSAGDAVAGDIIAFDGNGDQKIIKAEAWDTVKSKGYTPEGIVVVPASHVAAYGNETDTLYAMSIHLMTNDATGGTTSDASLVWGPYAVSDDVSGLSNYTSVVFGTDGSISGGTVGTRSYAYIPSDAFVYNSKSDKGTEARSNGVSCFNSDFRYYYRSSENQGVWCIPSPYLTDGSPNPLFYNNGNNEVLSKQFGKGATNTAVLYALMNDSNLATRKNLLLNGVTDDNGTKLSGASITLWANDDAFTHTVITSENQGSDRQYMRMYPVTADETTVWYGVGAFGKPAIGATIWGGWATDKTKDTDYFYTYPAALATKLYGTTHKTAGNWFLPDAAQLALVMPYKDRIKYALATLTSDYAAPWNNSWLWSSSECSSHHAWSLAPSNGGVSYYFKCYSYRVRAFAAFNA